MLSVIYIATVLLLSAMITANIPEATFGKLKGMEAAALLSALLTAAFLGGVLPEVLHDRLGWSLGPHWLERTAQLTGAISFVYMAYRGLVLWLTIFVLAITYYILKGLWNLVVHFYST